MQNTHFTRILRNDVNLLITLHHLLEKRRLELVAQELCLGQSAISHHLARLRDIFGDRLLVRTAKGAALTPLAEQLRPQVAELLAQLEKLFFPDITGEYWSQKTVYRLCLPDDLCTEHLPALFIKALSDDIARTAVTFEILASGQHSMDALREGKIDFLFSLNTTQVKGVYTAALPGELCHVAVRPGHPLAGKQSCHKQLSRFPLVEMSDMSLSAFPDSFSDNTVVKTLLRTASVGIATSALLHSDSWSILPDYTIKKHGLGKVYLPGGALLLQYYLHWHQVVNNDALHIYLRENLHLYFKNTFFPAKTGHCQQSRVA